MEAPKESGMCLVPISTVHGFPIFFKDKPSEEFLESVIHCGSTNISCEFCGRFHIGSDFRRGEDSERYEEYSEKAQQQPGGEFIEHDADMVSWGILDGKQYVVDCPCHAGVAYERLFWKHLELISNYSIKRAELMKQNAERVLEYAQAIAVPK